MIARFFAVRKGTRQTASYVIKQGQGLMQWDLRACCTSGDT
jgi:hypothetical protein